MRSSPARGAWRRPWGRRIAVDTDALAAVGGSGSRALCSLFRPRSCAKCSNPLASARLPHGPKAAGMSPFYVFPCGMARSCCVPPEERRCAGQRLRLEKPRCTALRCVANTVLCVASSRPTRLPARQAFEPACLVELFRSTLGTAQAARVRARLCPGDAAAPCRCLSALRAGPGALARCDAAPSRAAGRAGAAAVERAPRGRGCREGRGHGAGGPRRPHLRRSGRPLCFLLPRVPLCALSSARTLEAELLGRVCCRRRLAGRADAPTSISRGAECPYCGDLMISIVSLPFVDPVEEAELTASWEV